MRELNPVEKQWLFEPDTLNNLPSSIHGIPLEKELRKRRRTILSIRSLALRTGLCQSDDVNSKGARGVMTVAATLLHRFYMRRSFADFSEELMAGTILFLASKIEEEPLKLRHICNACLDKFENDREGGWHPTDDHGPPPSHAYQRWEKEILATEEIVLETLCFDMGIEQPWPTLRRSIRGIDELRIKHDQSQSQPTTPTPTPTSTNGEQGRLMVTEDIVAEMGWPMLSEASLSPLPILHPAPILAFAIFVLVIAAAERLPISEAIAIASDLSPKFDIDISCDESGIISGSDVDETQRCCHEFVDYCKMGLIDSGFVTGIPREPTETKPRAHGRRYQLPNPARTGTTEVKPAVKTSLAGERSWSNGNANSNGDGARAHHDLSPSSPKKSPKSPFKSSPVITA